MKRQSSLRLMLLAALQRPWNNPPTRYRIMITINQIYAILNKPYSPGAIYHELSKLDHEKMIIIDHEEATIQPAGIAYLHASLLEAPLPLGLLPIIEHATCIALLTDAKTRAAAKKKLQIEMIKIDHSTPNLQRSGEDNNLAPSINLIGFSEKVRRSVLAVVAEL